LTILFLLVFIPFAVSVTKLTTQYSYLSIQCASNHWCSHRIVIITEFNEMVRFAAVLKENRKMKKTISLLLPFQK